MKMKDTNGVAAAQSAQATSENMQWTKYKNPKGGHGFAAEDANALLLRAAGRRVQVVGGTNAKNGPDLLVGGREVQVKYHASAQRSIGDCFDADGLFRYGGKQIMVPRDQYEEAVRLMERKIAEGKVPGVMAPSQARQMVLRGKITHRQALRLRQAGTKESLAFDVVSQATAAGVAGAIGGAATFVQACRTGATKREAAHQAAKATAATSAKTLATGVATQQLLRTQVGRQAAAQATHVARRAVKAAYQTQAGRACVDKLAQGVCGTAVRGGAATSVVTKALRGNMLTSTVMFAVGTVPDTVRLCRGKITAREYGCRTAESAASTAGGSVGYMAGMALGTAVCPGIGTVIGGLVGSLCGGMAAGAGARKLCRHH